MAVLRQLTRRRRTGTQRSLRSGEKACERVTAGKKFMAARLLRAYLDLGQTDVRQTLTAVQGGNRPINKRRQTQTRHDVACGVMRCCGCYSRDERRNEACGDREPKNNIASAFFKAVVNIIFLAMPGMEGGTTDWRDAAELRRVRRETA